MPEVNRINISFALLFALLVLAPLLAYARNNADFLVESPSSEGITIKNENNDNIFSLLLGSTVGKIAVPISTLILLYMVYMIYKCCCGGISCTIAVNRRRRNSSSQTAPVEEIELQETNNVIEMDSVDNNSEL